MKEIATRIEKPLPLFNLGIAVDHRIFGDTSYPDSVSGSGALSRHIRSAPDRSPGEGLPGCPEGGGDRACSMLDNNTTYQQEPVQGFNSLTHTQKKLKIKKGRYYHCLVSGMKWHKKDQQYFLTLTSAPGSPGLYKSFNHLVTLVRMATPNTLVKGDYMSRKEALKWFQKDDLDKCLTFEYCKLQTSEGCGVLHIVFAGSRLPIKFIRAVWSKIHDARQIVIKHVEKDDEDDNKRLKNYLMKQYLYGQDGFIRYSCSGGWIYPGYRDDWVKMVKLMGYWEARKRWEACMELHRKPGQMDFNGAVVYTPSEKSRFRKARSEVKNGSGR